MPGSATHGGSGTLYNQGCRCELCTEAHRVRMMLSNRTRFNERIRGANGDWYAPRASTHGTSSTYTNWGCRCDPCRAEAAVRNRAWRDAHPRGATSST